MQEFRIQTRPFAPSFGRTPGWQISIVTRPQNECFHYKLCSNFSGGSEVRRQGLGSVTSMGLAKARASWPERMGVCSAGPGPHDKTSLLRL